jgi:cation-transporting ATPase 13A1
MNHYHDITPLRAYHPLLRLDTLPFIIVYTILILVDNLSGPTSTARLQHWNTLLLFPLTLFIHITLFVWTRWNIRIEALVGYKTVERNDFHAWTHCLVIPPNPTISKVNKASNSSASVVGRSEIIPVQIKCVPQTSQGLNTSKQIDGSASLDRWVATISYEEMVFRCCFDDANNNNDDDDDDDINNRDDEMDGIWTKNSNTEIGSSTKSSPPKSQIIDRTNTKSSTSSSSSSSSMFHKLRYPSNLPLSFYTQQWIGHTTKQSIQRTINVYSNNNLNINLPPFLDLLTQQLLAPFFLFQLFCVLLWCLDEYWYYALFTLFTLVLFECTVAYTRLKNLLRLRETLRTPFAVWTYRCSKWEQISTNDLIVGDVISLSSSLTTSAHHDGVHIPADLLLMKGSAVVNEAMLTGESVPQIKESIDGVASALSGGGIRDENKLDIDDSTYKRSILFGGTVLVNHSNQSSASSPPGCIAMVLRTGFDTQQGSLLRTMIHTSTKAQSDGVNTKDTFLFILILLLCAVFSSLVVLKHGWNDPTRNRFKLILHVIIIITSVVPPELPMELSLAVTSSLADLITRCSVYCTEPFRIPLAGMVDTCAFDKTGTLTSDEMVLRGVRLVINGNKGDVDISESLVLPPRESDDDDDDNDGDKDGNGNGSNETIPPNVMRVMVGCQSLASLSGYNQTLNATSTNLIGDPLEKAVLEGCGWTLLSNTTVAPPQKLLSSSMGMINIQHRFAFTSKLKRMTVIATDLGNKKNLALTKGAPETLKEFFDASSLPESYDSVSRYHMSLGQRVLAMGYKELSSKVTVASWKKRGREEVESNLIFAGFLILDCPLKPDSRKVIKELRRSGHDVVMITGDAILTAAEVARQVGIIDKSSKADTYELRDIRQDDSNAIGAKFAFVPINTIDKNIASIDKQIAYSLPNLEVVKNMLASSEIRAICVSGDALNKLAMEAVRLKGHADTIIDVKSVLLHPDAQTTLQEIVPIVSVFARHAPRQKEAVIAAFNGAGRYTLMCGESIVIENFA